MPTYEYVCDSCEHRFELMQRMKDDPVKVCPECGKSVRRVLSGGIGISFKGSGFYVNDSGSSGSTGSSSSAGSGSGTKASHDGSCSCCHAKADSACPGKSGNGS